MTPVERIINRYVYIYYSENKNWLKCNKYWNVKLCRCVDEIELNILSLLFNSIVYKQNNMGFEFRDYTKNSYYYMKITNKDCNISNLNFCDYCKDMRVVKHDPHANKIGELDSANEQNKIVRYDESVIMYCALCLLAVNSVALNRHDIFKFYLLKCKNAFSKYLVQFKIFLKETGRINNTFLKYHIELIEFILKKYALNEESNIFGNILDVFDNDVFKRNYKIENNAEIIKEQLEEDLAGYITDELPMLNFMVYSDQTTIISVITDIAKLIKCKSDWKLYKVNFGHIYDYFLSILKQQRRENEDKFQSDMEALKKIMR